MQAKAKLSRLRISPRKVRLVADVIRGLDVEIAENQLGFINKKVARSMLKLLKSAIANAENNFKLKKNNLYISELRVDEGPTLKRWMPRAMGRATPVNKRTSHISIVLNEKVETKKLEDKKDKDKKKIDKDVKIVKSLDEAKELYRQGSFEGEKDKVDWEENEGVKKSGRNIPLGADGKIRDIRREGSDRRKQHLDKIHKKDKGGVLKKIFRRKAV